jgi:prepilin-type N-terminal cleavage/methylation domain-containing protein
LTSNKGFTLIEIVIVIVVLSIVGVFTFSFLADSAKTYQMMRDQRDLHQEAAYVLERISRELRDTTCVFPGSFPGVSIYLQKAHPTLMSNSLNSWFFYSNDLQNPNLYILYRWDLTSIPPKMMAKNAPRTFNQYFDYQSNNATIAEDDTFTVTVVATKNSQTVTLSTTVCPKNYRSGGPFNCALGNNNTGRSFNRDYYDVIN